MAFTINADERSVPWYSKNEFFEVFSWLSDAELGSKYMALSRLKVWEERSQGVTKQCPIAVMSTIYILNAMLQDNVWDWKIIGDGIKSEVLNENNKLLLELLLKEDSCSREKAETGTEDTEIYNSDAILSLKMQYSLAIIRIINLFVDQSQFQFFARSISAISTELGIPQILVEIRHSATHGSELPTLETCRVGGVLIFFYLISNYWRKQHMNLLNSIKVFNDSIQMYFNNLLKLLKILSFNWDVHRNLFEDSNRFKFGETLLDSYKKYHKIYHSSLSKVTLRYISVNIPIRNKALNYFQEMSVERNKRKFANKMISSLSNFTDFENKSDVKLKRLKSWVKKCYSLLPAFYYLVDKIMNTIESSYQNELILKDFILNQLLENICPLCSPISEIAILQIFNLLSINLKLEVLSRLVLSIIQGHSTEDYIEIEKKNRTYRRCTQNKYIRFFYWLRTLLPNLRMKKTINNEEKYEHFIGGNVTEVILLLTFYKRLDKSKKAKSEMNYEKIIDRINLSKQSFLLIFSKLLNSIPSLIINKNITLNYRTLSLLRLIEDLQIFEATASLMHAFFKSNHSLILNNLGLLEKFIEPEYNFYEGFWNDKVNKRKVIIENFGITPLLKVGTSWDGENWKVIDHIDVVQDDNKTVIDPRELDLSLNCIETKDGTDEIELDCNCSECNEYLPEASITLNLEGESFFMKQMNPLDMCLLNAEAFARKNLGKQELMKERALNIDWSRVKNISR
ncbi:Las1-domain-containing protein [Cryptosporidium felis]|nr:Las1-domain-containing protein [Cryptosporidium felis]